MTKEQAKQRAEIMLAWANGETIQYRFKGDAERWVTASSGGQLVFDWDDVEYRIKTVWTLSNHIPGFRPLRDGEEWHQDSWTREMLPDGWRPLLLGEAVLKGKQGDEYYLGDDVWSWQQNYGVDIAGQVKDHRWRTKRPLPEPKPKLKTVPLEAGDVPPGSVFRRKDWLPGIHRSYFEINATGVYWTMGNTDNPCTDWMDLMNHEWQLLRPGSTTWEKCEKIVEEKGEG